jgi:hypothetical protein
MTDRYPFDRAVVRQPGVPFGALGVSPDTVVVPETRTYHSADCTISRRYREGDLVPAQEALLLGIIPSETGELVPASELSEEEAISFLRGRGYQVSPMTVAGPMGAPIPDEALIAHVQEQGFQVEKPGEGLPELEGQVVAPHGGDDTLTSPAFDGAPVWFKKLVDKAIDEGRVVPELKPGETQKAYEARLAALAKAEGVPDNKAERAPENKSE